MRTLALLTAQNIKTTRFCLIAAGALLLFPKIFFQAHAALANTEETVGKVGRGQRKVKFDTCQVPVIGKDLVEGDLAEIIDKSGQRVALVKIERIKSSSQRLVGTVLVGSEKCNQLRGLAMRPVVSGESGGSATESGKGKNDILRVAPKYILAQSALPGLALNKFLTPGYTQRGFAVGGSVLLPREPIAVGRSKINFKTDVAWTSLTTSPSIDIVKDGKIEGIQSITTQIINARAGARIFYLDARLWSGVGAILYDSFKSKSQVSSVNGGDAEKILRVIRDLNGSGFGLYAEQGFIINRAAEISLSGGIGLKTSITTPIVEDGDATNASETASIEGLPLFAGASFRIPFLSMLFAEVNLEYRKYAFSVPLINDGTSKAQFDNLLFAAGLGVNF
ncbi:MAG: hypothetical protein RL189_31 [Pseudomonadota bacterium]